MTALSPVSGQSGQDEAFRVPVWISLRGTASYHGIGKAFGCEASEMFGLPSLSDSQVNLSAPWS